VKELFRAKKYVVMAIVLAGLVFAASCKKADKKTAAETLHELYLQYKEGEINECQYNGQTVYKCSSKVYTEGSSIYDQAHVNIGNCNYTSGDVDAKCDMLLGCKTIYRDSNFYSGQPFIDAYGLGK
jgi:hypothetical protein